MNRIKCFKKEERDTELLYYATVDMEKKRIEWSCEVGFPKNISAEDKKRYASALDMQLYGVTMDDGFQTFEDFLNEPKYDLNMEVYNRIVYAMKL